MIDEEFSRSHELDKAPWVLALRKKGMKGNYWETINNDVSFRRHTALRLYLLATFYTMRNERCVQSASSTTAGRHFTGACLA
jgi:hypothetical protein